jgi:mono/diheme cytochrome c family protein
MAPFMLIHRVIRIALQRSWKCDLRSMLVGRDVLSTLALVFFAYPALSGSVRSEKSAQEISVYSESQAVRGHDLYAENCASCHGAMLEGEALFLSRATFEGAVGGRKTLGR